MYYTYSTKFTEAASRKIKQDKPFDEGRIMKAIVSSMPCKRIQVIGVSLCQLDPNALGMSDSVIV